MTRGINIAEHYRNLYSSYGDVRKPVVFLSHKSEDKAYVEAIGEYIMNAGIDIYLDKDDFKLQKAVAFDDAKKVTECIEMGISQCDYILCFVSDKTKLSWWVPYEIGYGKKSSKKIATLVHSNVHTIPDYLKIEEIIKNIDGINDYIKKISESHGIPIYESYDWVQRTDGHLIKPSDNHPLASYLRVR